MQNLNSPACKELNGYIKKHGSSIFTVVDIVTLELKSLSLCGNSTLAVYNGFNKTARLMATYNSDSPAVLRLRFPAASGAR